MMMEFFNLQTVLEKDDDGLEEQELDETELYQADVNINTLENCKITEFVNQCSGHLNSMLRGEIKNYRLDVMRKKPVLINQIRLMPHHLPMHNINLGSGNFTDAHLDCIRKCLHSVICFDERIVDKENFVELVFVPVVVVWLVVDLFRWNLAQSRYYCRMGGYHRGKEALRKLERKAAKNKEDELNQDIDNNVESEHCTEMPDNRKSYSLRGKYEQGSLELEEAQKWCLRKQDPPNFELHFIDKVIGYGVFVTDLYLKGSFLMEYCGELIGLDEAEKREDNYEENHIKKQMYFFDYNGGRMCVDATNSNRLSRFINHSVQGNCVVKINTINTSPRLCLYAQRDIPYGEELRYNHGKDGHLRKLSKIHRKPFHLQSLYSQDARHVKSELQTCSTIIAEINESFQEEKGLKNTTEQVALLNDDIVFMRGNGCVDEETSDQKTTEEKVSEDKSNGDPKDIAVTNDVICMNVGRFAEDKVSVVGSNGDPNDITVNDVCNLTEEKVCDNESNEDENDIVVTNICNLAENKVFDDGSERDSDFIPVSGDEPLVNIGKFVTPAIRVKRRGKADSSKDILLNHKKKCKNRNARGERKPHVTTAKAVWAKVHGNIGISSDSEGIDEDNNGGSLSSSNSKDVNIVDSLRQSNYNDGSTFEESSDSDDLNSEEESCHTHFRNSAAIKQGGELESLKNQIELLQKRLICAERAAERQYELNSDNEAASTGKGRTTKNKRRKGIGKRKMKDNIKGDKKLLLGTAKKLAKKRRDEKKQKKLTSCVNQYVGPPGTIKERFTGIEKKRKMYDIQCSYCPFIATRLHQHLMLKHTFEKDEAKLQESKIRVMYLWAQKEKHGLAKPLPCEQCKLWYMRLDNHLKKFHEMTKDQVSKVLELAREKYWCNAPKMLDSSLGKNTQPVQCKMSAQEVKSMLSNTSGATVNYLPKNAKAISDNQKVLWNITSDYFLMYYESSEDLLVAFQAEIAKKKGETKAVQYRQHVDYIWTIVDPKKAVLPACLLRNYILIEDKYHLKTYNLVGKGGNEASTLRVRFVALRAFIRFLKRRKVYGGITRSELSTLLEYIEDWNSDFTDLIAQRKTDIRRIKKKRLMTPSHMIKYGRSKFVQSLVGKIESRNNREKLTTRFAQNVRDYLITNLCIMNGLRSSNVIEVRVLDVTEAQVSEEYPGYMTFTNSQYKTSTIYGEKVIVLPKKLFEHLKYYVSDVRQILNPESNTYLFVSTDAEQMTHGADGSAITSSFGKSDVFGKEEYKRTSPTRIRCACATIGCKEEGIDSGYFAKHFMKNKEDTTNIHYNMYSNHREALKLAMLMGDTFEVGGVTKKVKKQEIEELTSEIYKSEKIIPSKDDILKWISRNNHINAKEMSDFVDILRELDEDSKKLKKFYASSTKTNAVRKCKRQRKSDSGTNEDIVKAAKRTKIYPKRQGKVSYNAHGDDDDGDDGDDGGNDYDDDDYDDDDDGEDEDDIDDDSSYDIHEAGNTSNANLALPGARNDLISPGKSPSKIMVQRFDKKEWYDLIRARKHKRSIYLALSFACEELITRDDYTNVFNTKTFTVQEVQHCIEEFHLTDMFRMQDFNYWKYLVLNMRTKFQTKVKNGALGEWQLWMRDAKQMLSESTNADIL